MFIEAGSLCSPETINSVWDVPWRITFSSLKKSSEKPKISGFLHSIADVRQLHSVRSASSPEFPARFTRQKQLHTRLSLTSHLKNEKCQVARQRMFVSHILYTQRQLENSPPGLQSHSVIKKKLGIYTLLWNVPR